MWLGRRDALLRHCKGARAPWSTPSDRHGPLPHPRLQSTLLRLHRELSDRERGDSSLPLGPPPVPGRQAAARGGGTRFGGRDRFAFRRRVPGSRLHFPRRSREGIVGSLHHPPRIAGSSRSGHTCCPPLSLHSDPRAHTFHCGRACGNDRVAGKRLAPHPSSSQSLFPDRSDPPSAHPRSVGARAIGTGENRFQDDGAARGGFAGAARCGRTIALCLRHNWPACFPFCWNAS